MPSEWGSDSSVWPLAGKRLPAYHEVRAYERSSEQLCIDAYAVSSAARSTELQNVCVCDAMRVACEIGQPWPYPELGKRCIEKLVKVGRAWPLPRHPQQWDRGNAFLSTDNMQ
jgi:hypothetical protein